MLRVMDPALLKERELFKKKALATPTVEKKRKTEPVRDDFRKKQKTSETSFSYKSVGGNEYKFSVLAKLVKYMKTRHQEGEDHSLSLDELLDETSQVFVSSAVKQWLETEALRNNPKIAVTDDNKYIFNPPLKIKDKKALLRLLKQYDLKGQGGIMLEDIQESLPNSEKALKHLQNEIICITRPADKKKVVFYNDKSAMISIDEEFQKLWRSIPVENMDDEKIEDYLEKQGIKFMQDYGLKKVAPPVKRKKPNRSRLQKKPRDNEHLADVLEIYDDTLN